MMKENTKNNIENRLIDATLVNTYLKKREKGIHKGQCGRLLIVAGSHGMAGAAILCARGALRSGAGLVTISAPEDLFPILQISVPEAICVSRSLSASKLSQYDAIALGPGLGVDEENEILIGEILQSYQKTIVADADALTILSTKKDLFLKRSGQLVITPHPGEAARILRCSTTVVQADRREAALLLAKQTGAVAVLKGEGTIVATDAATTYINTTGNPGMATGGSGDVLTGVITSLTGQGLSPASSALCGVYLHGLAGDLMAKRMGEYSLIASDIAEGLSSALLATLAI